MQFHLEGAGQASREKGKTWGILVPNGGIKYSVTAALMLCWKASGVERSAKSWSKITFYANLKDYGVDHLAIYIYIYIFFFFLSSPHHNKH